MTGYYATWLAEVLRARGVKVIEVAGWKTRGHGGLTTKPKYLINHHTAGPRNGNAPSLDVVAYGRPGLSGPLSNALIARDGTWYVIAAGKCYHAGKVRNENYANEFTLGWEIEATGVDGVATDYPPAQMKSVRLGNAAVADYLAMTERNVLAHKEVCSPVGRKIDPNFSMPQLRQDVEMILDRWHAEPEPSRDRPEPLFELKRILKNESFPKRKMRGMDVEKVALALVRAGHKLPGSRSTRTASGYDGIFGSEMERAVRAFQKRKNLTADGRVGRDTARALGGKFTG